jgi:hypothetical protein
MSHNILPRELRQPFAKSLGRSSVAESQSRSRASSQASQATGHPAGSSDVDGFDLNIGDGEHRLENIFNNVTSGTTGPSLAEESFQAAQQQEPPTPLPSNNSSLMLATPNQPLEFNTSAYLADVDELEWPDALDFYALMAHKCWHCGGENHYGR